MQTASLKVFRVRGRYYSLFERRNGSPSGVGKEFVAEIPSDPGAFEGSPPSSIESIYGY